MIFSTAVSGLQDIRLPQWGRSFWQDPNDDEIFLAYGSGTSEVDFITSVDGGNTWSSPSILFPTEDFHIHNNFDTIMDRKGHIHCGFRFNGSGCYQFVGKVAGGGWTRASGIGPVGLVDAGDLGNLTKGFQGSLTMQEVADGGEAGTFPVVKIGTKNNANDIKAFILSTPYNTGPLIDTVFGSQNTGADGGFPVIYVANNASHIVYYDEPSNTIDRLQKSGGTYWSFQSIAVGPSDVSFGPSMAIGSGIGFSQNAGIVVACSSGVNGIGQGVYAHNAFNNYENVFDVSNGTENSWVAKAGFEHGNPSGVLQHSGVVPTGNMYGVGPNTFSSPGVTVHNFPGEGTNCDFSFNDDGDFLFYFQKKNEWGRQSIGRFKPSFDGTSWVFPTMDDANRGLKHVAPVGQDKTGGWSNMLFWGGFKALKHPTEPAGASGTKKELLVTRGHVATYPSGGILTTWDVANSPALGEWQESEFSMDYTITSGTAHEIFVGISAIANFQFTTHVDRLPFMFDDSYGVSTEYGLIRDGYMIELEFDKQRTVDRIEILHRNLISTPAPGVAISGSMDKINWTRVERMPSGIISGPNSYNDGNSLVKYQARGQTVTESENNPGPSPNPTQPINNLDPFVSKFIRLQFENTDKGSHRVYEIKLYGPASTNPEVVTWSDDGTDPPPYNRLFITGSNEPRTEKFYRQQGTLPVGWRTSGDFEWAVVGSGEATRTGNSTKPTDPLPFDYNGQVPSGIWATTNVGNKRGVGDGFSIRSEAIGDASGLGNPLRNVPSDGIKPGMSGVLEVDINILLQELNSLGNTGRRVGFNIRSDVHIDDTIDFYINNALQQTYSDIGWNTFSSYTLGVDEFVEPDFFDITGFGTHTLKWVYNKGAYDPVVNTNIYPFGAAWIDGVFGLDGGPIEGAPRNQRYGFLRGGNPFEISTIHGYLQGVGFSSIHGYLPSGLPQQGFIHGFLTGLGTEASGQIHGYMLGHEVATSQIHSYLVGNVPIDPTGIDSSIHGYTIAGFGSGNNSEISAINGVLQGNIGGQFIHGYVNVESGSFNDSIRKGFATGWDGGILGLGTNQKAIFGYLKAPLDSGNASIHGYILGNFPVSSIHGYLGSEFLVASGGGLVGDPSTSNVVPRTNFIHGFLRGDIGGQFIHGYVKRPSGVFSNIHGYVLSGKEDESIHGYLRSFEHEVELIHSYASGVGFNTQSIHGYAFGMSGIISNSIHGYIEGVNIPVSNIWGTLIGTVDAQSSFVACPSHNFPLSAPLSITLPSGFVN